MDKLIGPGSSGWISLVKFFKMCTLAALSRIFIVVCNNCIACAEKFLKDSDSQHILADDSSIAAPNDPFKGVAAASVANADSQPPPPPRSPFASTNNQASVAKAEENIATEEAGFVLPPPIPTGDSEPKT
uniref:Uncharacterized protein n=1 Tax=Romanomermis culicivorax TaxID=13658 RepID=A0A915K6S0_ROMCU